MVPEYDMILEDKALREGYPYGFLRNRTWELYESSTVQLEEARTCLLRNGIPRGALARVLKTRKKFTKWKEQKIFYVCAHHYKQETGKELRSKSLRGVST